MQTSIALVIPRNVPQQPQHPLTEILYSMEGLKDRRSPSILNQSSRNSQEIAELHAGQNLI
jgi:hypothetical protein